MDPHPKSCQFPELRDLGRMTQYFRIPHSDKDRAKQLGARWDATVHHWYADNEATAKALSAHWGVVLNPPTPLSEFPGEDRTFGPAKTEVDMLPSSCWTTTYASCISKADDRRIRLGVRQRCGSTCELCQAKEDAQRGIYVGVMPRYAYVDGRQVLRRLMGVCSTCADAVEYGQTQSRGLGGIAKRHLMAVNDWSGAEAQQHIQRAYELWSERSRQEWALDLSILEAAGLEVVLPTREQRQASGVNLAHVKPAGDVADLLARIDRALAHKVA